MLDPALHRKRASYYRRVFPTPSLAELEGRIERIRAELGRFRGVRVRRLAKHVFAFDCTGRSGRGR